MTSGSHMTLWTLLRVPRRSFWRRRRSDETSLSRSSRLVRSVRVSFRSTRIATRIAPEAVRRNAAPGSSPGSADSSTGQSRAPHCLYHASGIIVVGTHGDALDASMPLGPMGLLQRSPSAGEPDWPLADIVAQPETHRRPGSVTNGAPVAVYDRNATTFRPLLPEPIDQGDPFLLEAPSASGAMHRFYVYATGPDPENGWAFPLYGSDDLSTWRRIGMSLQSDRTGSHWAPCVRYVPALARPWLMLYSSAVGFGDEGHIGHTLRRADAERPEGPFVESGEVLTPDLDFAIDADVYRMPDGGLRVAYAMDFVEDEPYGTGIVEAPISDDLTTITGERRLLARPQFDWHVYDAARVMPWKTIPGIDWSRRAVRWHTVEAPV